METVKKKHTGMGIAAFVLSFFGPLALIGLILAIIDLVKDKEKEHKHGLTIAAIVISAIMIIAIGSSSTKNSDKSGDTASSTQQTTVTEEASDETTKQVTEVESVAEVEAEPEPEPESESTPEVEYIKCTKEELSDALQSNALKASDTYKDKYIEVSGYLDVIDSSGKYISINSGEDDWSFVNVQCFIKNDDQKSIVMDLNTGDALTIKGKCKDVGEVIGYSIDIDEIIVE